MKHLIAIAVIAISFAWSTTILADAGNNTLTTDAVAGSTNGCNLRPGAVCYFAFDSTTVGNTRSFSIAYGADICLNTDVALTTDSGAIVSIYRVISDDTLAGSMLPSESTAATLAHGEGDCLFVPTGIYWVRVDTSPTVGKTAAVSVTVRN